MLRSVSINRMTRIARPWVRLSSSQVPFDPEPFPFSRFEPCCSDQAEPMENGFVQCAKHPIPQVIGKKVDMTTELRKYERSRQLLVCVGPEAPEWSRAKVESVKDGLIHQLQEEHKSWLLQGNRATNPAMLLTTACERPSASSRPACDILMLPEFRRFPAVDPSTLSSSPFMKTMQALWNNPTTSPLPDPGIPYEDMDDIDTLVLVCTHTMRDKRCGILGPLIVDEFRKVLDEKNLLTSKGGKVEVWGVSHFGGHAFAGNVIIHQKGLGGHAYGNVRACHVPSIVDRHIIHGKVIKELWRGAVTHEK
ncbi:hypothetical protein LRAMOSA09609 [Lichtheimia ramosa]|uniref:Sucrase/ferredoxin-like-domain-containing protein n=1 Tax=Lichtheimia ramosa TaxID=688394 RepID=A0A077WH58_9FUNG|nr:hypothetical protein LRAMOSA09609 [Lichtheimia ramosa]